jgi:hypothetical protein
MINYVFIENLTTKSYDITEEKPDFEHNIW